jgi:hypothetical protein
VKETVLEVGQTKSVSMPSEVFLDGGVDVERIAGRAGSVNERRLVVEAYGACSAIVEEAGRDMMDASCRHVESIGGRAQSGAESARARVRDWAVVWSLVVDGRLQMACRCCAWQAV